MDQKKLILMWLFFAGIILSFGPSYGASFYPERLDDPAAVYLTPEGFPVHGDGVGDDSAGLQQAIDKVASSAGAGVLFVPKGTYRLTKTVYVWPGVRLIGYGDSRPVLTLGENTPGFQEGTGKYMLFFSGGRGFGRSAGRPPSGWRRRHVLQRHEQYRHRDRTGQSRRCRHPLPCGPALLRRPCRLPARLGPRWAGGHRQRGRRPSLPRRSVRHRHATDRRRAGPFS